MSMIRMLACCCDGGGPDGPGTDSPLCNVVQWCYANRKMEPDLISFATTGTKPSIKGFTNVQTPDWVTTVTGVTVTSKTYLGGGGGLSDRWRFDIEWDYTAVYSGTSGSANCGCQRAGVWEPFDTTSFSGTGSSRIILGCDSSTTPNHSISVSVSTISPTATFQQCDPPVNIGASHQIEVSGGAQLTAGPFPKTLMDTCTELETLAIAFETPVKLSNAEGCGTEAHDSDLHRITFNFKYQ
tara:strand:+ start:25 stop:744 length:720 start_codon:yes stop_codon:yes gene_type:complete